MQLIKELLKTARRLTSDKNKKFKYTKVITTYEISNTIDNLEYPQCSHFLQTVIEYIPMKKWFRMNPKPLDLATIIAAVVAPIIVLLQYL